MSKSKSVQRVTISAHLARALFGHAIFEWMFPKPFTFSEHTANRYITHHDDAALTPEFFEWMNRFFKENDGYVSKERLFPYVLFPADVMVTGLHKDLPMHIAVDVEYYKTYHTHTLDEFSTFQQIHDKLLDLTFCKEPGMFTNESHDKGGMTQRSPLHELDVDLEDTAHLTDLFFWSKLKSDISSAFFEQKLSHMSTIVKMWLHSPRRFQVKQFATITGCEFKLSMDDFKKTFANDFPNLANLRTPSSMTGLLEAVNGREMHILRGGILLKGKLNARGFPRETMVMFTGDSEATFIPIDSDKEKTTKVELSTQQTLREYFNLFNKSE